MTTLNDFLDPEDRSLPGIHFIDMSQVCLATASANFVDQTINEDFMRHLILSTIKFNVLKHKRDYPITVCAFDNKVGGYWRRRYGYYYKKNRAKLRSKSNFDWEGYFNAMNTVLPEFIENMPYISLYLQGIEADDIIAVLTKRAALEGRPIRITSSDGDYTQLHKYPGVKQWSPMHKKFVTPKTGQAQLDLMTKLLKGDKKDGVAGIKSRSDYIITKLDGERAPSITTDFIMQCLEADDPRTLMTEAEAKRFDENQIMINFDFIPDDISNTIIEAYDNHVVPARGKMYPYFVKNRLVKLLPNINDF